LAIAVTRERVSPRLDADLGWNPSVLFVRTRRRRRMPTRHAQTVEEWREMNDDVGVWLRSTPFSRAAPGGSSDDGASRIRSDPARSQSRHVWPQGENAAGVGSGGEVGRGAGREGRKSDIGGTQGPRGKTSRMTTDALCTPTAVGGVWVSGCLYPGRAPTTNSPKCSDPFLPTRHRYLLRFRQYSDLK